MEPLPSLFSKLSLLDPVNEDAVMPHVPEEVAKRLCQKHPEMPLSEIVNRFCTETLFCNGNTIILDPESLERLYPTLRRLQPETGVQIHLPDFDCSQLLTVINTTISPHNYPQNRLSAYLGSDTKKMTDISPDLIQQLEIYDYLGNDEEILTLIKRVVNVCLQVFSKKVTFKTLKSTMNLLRSLDSFDLLTNNTKRKLTAHIERHLQANPGITLLKLRLLNLTPLVESGITLTLNIDNLPCSALLVPDIDQCSVKPTESRYVFVFDSENLTFAPKTLLNTPTIEKKQVWVHSMFIALSQQMADEPIWTEPNEFSLFDYFTIANILEDSCDNLIPIESLEKYLAAAKKCNSDILFKKILECLQQHATRELHSSSLVYLERFLSIYPKMCKLDIPTPELTPFQNVIAHDISLAIACGALQKTPFSPGSRYEQSRAIRMLSRSAIASLCNATTIQKLYIRTIKNRTQLQVLKYFKTIHSLTIHNESACPLDMSWVKQMKKDATLKKLKLIGVDCTKFPHLKALSHLKKLEKISFTDCTGTNHVRNHLLKAWQFHEDKNRLVIRKAST